MKRTSLNKKYREWRNWPDCETQINNISNDVKVIHFYRVKNSHQGIKVFSSVTELLVKQVDQNFLNEIGEMGSLEYLEIENLTAENLTPLLDLPNLRYLKICGMSNIRDFAPLTKIKTLRKLFLENSKHLSNLDFLDATQPLEVIGIEGSMYTEQIVESLIPLSKFSSLEAIFLSSVKLKNKNLDCLAKITNLAYLSCARFAPKSNFKSLRVLMPNLICNWCDKYEV